MADRVPRSLVQAAMVASALSTIAWKHRGLEFKNAHFTKIAMTKMEMLKAMTQ